jgi:peroxiredoxin
MAATESTMAPLGMAAPDFRLPDAISGRQVALADFHGASALVVMFICRHCPFVKHVRAGLAQLANEYQQRGAAVVAINSNDSAQFPEDAPDGMREEAREAGYTFPYLFDEDQQVAKAYRAACTPDFYVFDRERKLAYRGQMDDSRPGNEKPVTGADLRLALDAVLAGRSPAVEQKASIGCNIKWKASNEPEYFRVAGS